MHAPSQVVILRSVFYLFLEDDSLAEYEEDSLVDYGNGARRHDQSKPLSQAKGNTCKFRSCLDENTKENIPMNLLVTVAFNS